MNSLLFPSNAGQFLDTSGRFMSSLPVEPILLPLAPKQYLPGTKHLLAGRYPMTSEDRLRIVAFVAEHPGCGLAQITQVVGVSVDLNTILYAMTRGGILIRTGTKYHYVYRVAA